MWLIGQVFEGLRSGKTAALVLPATDVRPMHSPSTGELQSYYVENIPVDNVAIWARWPSSAAVCGQLAANIAFFAWLFRLAAKESKAPTYRTLSIEEVVDASPKATDPNPEKHDRD